MCRPPCRGLRGGRARHAAAIAAASLAAACGTTTPSEPGAVAIGFVARASQALDAPAGATSPPTVVSVNGAGIAVLGRMRTPNPCQNLTAAADRAGDTVTVTVTAASTVAAGSACVAALGDFTYRASLTLSPGTYRVIVRQAGAIGGETGVARDTTVGVVTAY